jgi:hypothetical protein
VLREVRLSGGFDDMKPRPGDAVVLTRVPPGLLEGLPTEDQDAIAEVVGKPVKLVAFDDQGRAELEFTDSDEAIHSIYVSPDFIRPAK